MSDAANTVWRYAGRRLAALGVLVLAGWALSGVGRGAAQWQTEHQPAFNAESLEGVAGQGVLLGVFGGLRAIMADFAWVRSYVYWEQGDRAGCETLMRTSIALDPSNMFFWLDAGRIMAYDMPYWEITRRRLAPESPEAAQIVRDHAWRSLAWFAKGAARNPKHEAEFWVRSAHVCLIRLKDLERGAEFYRKAAECGHPVWFAARSYVNILRYELGRKEDARLWLQGYLKKLETGDNPDPLGNRGMLEADLRNMEKGTK
jgi:hypothetical protein